jgi:Uma2 family endonuclease
MSVELQRWTFTVDDYHRLAEVGILTEDDRVELIDGEIIRMSPIGSRHVGCVNRLNAILSQRAGGLAIVSVQNPIHIDEYTEPEPDIALLRHRSDFYSKSLAMPEDVFLIIEVADTSLEYDRTVKLATHARAGIPEVWIADLAGEGLEVCSEPVNGVYQRIRRARRGQELAPEKLPGVIVRVDELLD